ncbi:C1 family peptidase [Methanobrevibacter sp.]|uniref:C1 family peptidase n=1 Tax=Methanobrevibacter sp. TaxID=66852 RepID=UPI003863C213
MIFSLPLYASDVENITDNDLISIDESFNEYTIGTDNQDEVFGDENPVSLTDIYVDESHNTYGNGSINNPYRSLEYVSLKNNVVIHLKEGNYKYSSTNLNNVTFIGQGSANTIINFDRTVISNNNLILQNLTSNKAFFNNAGNFTANDVIFQNSVRRASDSYGNSFGGCILTKYDEEDLTLHSISLHNCTFKSNSAEYGGVINAYNGYLDIVDCLFINNYATNYGGALCVENMTKIRIRNSRFVNVYSQQDAGGAIYAISSYLELDNVNFTQCYATFGSAITALNVTSNLNNVFANDNVANYDGGAIYHLYGNSTIANSTFQNNSAKNGGALFLNNLSTLTLINNQFINNSATVSAGAVYSVLNRDTLIENNSYDDNRAPVNSTISQIHSLDSFIRSLGYDLYNSSYNENIQIPYRYNLVDHSFVTSVKNQQGSGNCWAFASLAALESCILKASNVNYDFSEENMKNLMAMFSNYGWQVDPNGGGIDEISIGYLVGWLGPINESNDSFDDYSALSPLLNSLVHVQNVVYLKRENYLDNNEIKKAILKYGAVATGMHYDSAYLVSGGNYYYDGDEYSNHEVIIVGWDDSYSKSKFKNIPAGNGAFIIKNSWGPYWGDNGYGYVSYYDTRFAQVGDNKASFTFILNDTIKLDKNYQYDVPGITDYLITGNDTVWYENIFNASESENLVAVSTYFNDMTNWDVSVYVNNVLKTTKSGVSNPGYYTINLDNAVFLNEGDIFKVAFKIKTDSYANIPISESVFLNNRFYSSGVSFFSFNGEDWIDLYDYAFEGFNHTYNSQVASIKAFTALNLDSSIELSYQSGFNHAIIQAKVSDMFGNPLTTGNVVFNIEGIDYPVGIIEGIAEITHIFENRSFNNISAKIDAKGYNSSYAADLIELDECEIKINCIDGECAILFNLSDGAKGNISINVDGVEIHNKFIDSDYIFNLNNLSGGKHVIKAEYNDNIHKIINITKNITIPEANILSASSLTMFYKDGSTWNVTLTDIEGHAISNVAVKIGLNGAVSEFITDANGIVKFPIDLKPGTYDVNATFEGNELYSSSFINSTITVNKTKVNLTFEDNVLTYGNDPELFIRLTDNDCIPISNAIIYVNNTVGYYKYRTDSEGIAKVAVKLKPGEYEFAISYYGDDIYEGLNAFRTVVVNKMGIAIYIEDINVIYKENENYTVAVSDVNGNPVSGITVKVDNGIKVLRYRTGAGGIANVPVTLKPGEYTFTASFDGNGIYKPSSNSSTVIVNKANVNIDATDLVVEYKDGSNFTATLTDAEGNAITGITVKFDNGATTYRYHTDVNGVASAPIKLKPGTYTYVISFAGNSIYAAANITKTLTVEKGTPNLESSNVNIDYKNGNLTARLTDGDGNAITGVTVKFNNGAKTYRYHTDSNGVATAPINIKPGKYDYTISFDGNSLYGTVNTTAKVVVNKVEAVLTADDVSMTFKDGTNYTARLTDANGNAIAGAIVKVNNTAGVYKYKTDDEGMIHVPINLRLGEYAFTAFIEGNDIYNNCNATSTVVITR